MGIVWRLLVECRLDIYLLNIVNVPGTQFPRNLAANAVPITRLNIRDRHELKQGQRAEKMRRTLIFWSPVHSLGSVA